MARVDTYQLVEDLVKSGLSKKPAEILGRAFLDSSSTEEFISKEQFNHLEKEQTDIRTDLTVIKQMMSTKTDISDLHHKVEAVESRLENKIDLINSNIGWLKLINIAILTTVLGVAFAPVAQNMFKPPIQEVTPVISSKK